MFKSFSIAMLIVGTVIGAGFASGQELISFFGVGCSPFIAVLCALLIFILSVVFLYIGTKTASSDISGVNELLLGKFHVILDIFILFNSFVVLSGMLAGLDTIGNMFFPLAPIYSIGFGILCVFVVVKGSKGILSVSKIVVPVVIILLVFVCCFTTSYYGSVTSTYCASVLSAVIYICMNMMLAGTVLTTMGKLDKKIIVSSCVISSIILGILIFVLILALNSFAYSSAVDMPILYMAKQINPLIYALVVIVVVISIFTTMMSAMSGLVSWFELIFKSKIFSCVVVVLGAYIVSNIGFSKVVALLYPLIGVLGVFYALLALLFGLRKSPLSKPCSKLFKQCHSKIHDARKHTKNDSRSHDEIKFKHLPAVDDKVTKTS